MRRVFIAAAFAALALSSVSCKLVDLVADIASFGYDVNDPWGSWEKVDPGVYVGTEANYNEGDLIAKGTDNSMICCKVDGNYYVTPPKFDAFDAKNTVYEFGYSEYKQKKVLTCGMSIVSKEQSTDMFCVNANEEALKKTWGAKGVGICSTPRKYKKIAKGGDFLANYKTICEKYQKELPYTAPTSQLITSYTDYRGTWLSGNYPSDMDAKGWVVPYSGPGKLEFCTVSRQQGWDDHGNHKMLWGGCSFSTVTWVEGRVSNITYDDALTYVNTVKASGKYNKVYEDAAISGTISFKAGSNDEGEDCSGYSGYIHPTYEISFVDLLGGTLTIKFGVAYVTYV